jgi:hypothetical protein
VNEAKAAAGNKNVTTGGANIPKQSIQAGLLDEMLISLVPVLLGGGTPKIVQSLEARYLLEQNNHMMQQIAISQDELPLEFEEVTNELIHVLMAFDQSQINKVPPTGGWTAGQVGEHLFKSDSAILNTLHGPTKETKRAPDKNVDGINTAFLDFSTKMKSPDITTPADNVHHDKETLIMALKSNRDLISKAIKTLDLSPTCTDPVMSAIVGNWTRQEYINFVISHTHRHIHQLKKIHKHIE